MMYKIINTFVPQYLTKPYHIRSKVHRYSTRNRQLKPTQMRAFAQARVWNTVPSNIQSSPSVNLFKFNLKKYLLSKFLNS